MYVVVYVQMSAYVCTGQKSPWVVFQELFTLCLDTGSLIVLEASKYARMAEREVLGICLSPPTQCWGYMHMPSHLALST